MSSLASPSGFSIPFYSIFLISPFPPSLGVSIYLSFSNQLHQPINVSISLLSIITTAYTSYIEQIIYILCKEKKNPRTKVDDNRIDEQVL